MQDLPLFVCLSPNGKEASGFAMSTFCLLYTSVVCWVRPDVTNQSIMVFVGKGGIFKTDVYKRQTPYSVESRYLLLGEWRAWILGCNPP